MSSLINSGIWNDTFPFNVADPLFSSCSIWVQKGSDDTQGEYFLASTSMSISQIEDHYRNHFPEGMLSVTIHSCANEGEFIYSHPNIIIGKCHRYYLIIKRFFD